ncbi:MAG: hypothetical protein R6T96_07795 [Longimicrobiales bacterium]
MSRFFGLMWGDPAKYYFLVIKYRGSFRNIPVHSIEEAVAETLRWVDAGAEVFFAPSAFKSHDKRKAVNVVSVPGFWFDIDVGREKAAEGEGYTTVEEAETALAEFCAETGIPEPNVVVRSGGGLHVYWILTEPLDPETWKAFARMLEEVTKKWRSE